MGRRPWGRHMCSPIWKIQAPPAHMVLQPDLQHAPTRLAAFPATPGFVPIICIFSSSPHCRPNHKSSSSSSSGGWERAPHALQHPEAWLLRARSPSLPAGRGVGSVLKCPPASRV